MTKRYDEILKQLKNQTVPISSRFAVAFQTATECMRALGEKLSTETILTFYGLNKAIKKLPLSSPTRPNVFQAKARAKWDYHKKYLTALQTEAKKLGSEAEAIESFMAQYINETTKVMENNSYKVIVHNVLSTSSFANTDTTMSATATASQKQPSFTTFYTPNNPPTLSAGGFGGSSFVAFESAASSPAVTPTEYALPVFPNNNVTFTAAALNFNNSSMNTNQNSTMTFVFQQSPNSTASPSASPSLSSTSHTSRTGMNLSDDDVTDMECPAFKL